MSEAESSAPPSAEPRGASKPRWRRWLRNGLIGLAALLAVVVALLASVLWVPAVSGLALRTAATRWDRGVPGSVAWSTIDGSLAGGLTITALELRDGDDALLVSVERVELDLDPLALFVGEARVERLALIGVELHTEHRWQDLAGAPESAPEPEPPSPGYGPDLPVHVIAALELGEVEVYGAEGQLAGLSHLDLSVEGQGREASLALDLAGLGAALVPTELERAALRVSWTEPELRVEVLDLDSPLGTLRLAAPARVDVSTRRGGLSLALDVELEPLAPILGLDAALANAELPPRVGLELRGEASERAAILGLDLDLEAGGAVHLDASGVRDPARGSWTILAGLAAALAPALVDPRQPGIELDARARARRADAEAPIDARLDVRVREAQTRELVIAHASARADSFDPLAGEAALALDGLGIDLRASASHGGPSGPTRGALTLAIADLHAPLAFVAPILELAELDQVRGGVVVEAECGPPSPDATGLAALRCTPEVLVDSFHGFGTSLATARLDGTVDPLADEPGFDLDLDARGLLVADGGYALDRVEVSAAGRPSDLRIEATGAGRHDRFDLAVDVEQSEDARRVRFDRLSASTTRGAGGVPAAIELRAPGALVIHEDRVEIAALDLRAFGADIDAEGVVALSPARRHDLRLSIAGLDLASLDRAVPGPSMRGRADLDLRVAGPSRDPYGRLEVHGRELLIAGLELGDLDLDLRREPSPGPRLRPIEPAVLALARADMPGSNSGDLVVDLRLAGPFARRIELRAIAPISLAEGRLGRGPIAAALSVEDFELHELAALMPETPAGWDPTGPSAAPPGDPLLVPEGRVDLDLVATGTWARPELELAVRGTKLELDRAELGALRLRAHADHDAVELELDLSPGFVDAVSVRAHVPVELDLRRGRARWAKTDAHAISLDISGLDPQRLAAALGPSIPALGEALAALPLTGEFATGLRARGSADAPELDLRVHGRALALGPSQLGDVRVDLGYAHDMVLAQFDLASPLAARLDGWVELPISLDLLGPEPVVLSQSAALDGQIHARDLDLPELGALANTELGGSAGFDVRLAGTLAAPEATAALELRELATGRDEIGDLTATLAFAPTQVDLDLDLVRAGVHSLAVHASVPLETELFPPGDAAPKIAWRRTGSHRLQLVAESLDEGLLRAFVELPEDLRFDGAVALDGGGELGDFALDGTVHAIVAKGKADPVELTTALHLDEAEQAVELSLIPARGQGLDARLALALPVAAYVAGEHGLEATPYTLEVEAPAFDLVNLAGFLPPSLHDPVGILDAQFTGAGQIGAPALDGSLALRGAALTVVPLRQRLSELELELELSRERLELASFHVRAGKGGLRGSGHVDVISGTAPGLDASIELDIDDFPVVQPGLPAIVFDAGVDIELRSRPRDLELNIALREPELSVGTKAESAPKPIPTSDALVFVGEAEGLHTDDLPELDADGDADGGRLALTLELLDPLRIAGNPIDMTWTGKIELERVDGQLQASGQLDTRRGRIDLVGKQFDIQRGSVALPDDGKIDPYIDLIATTQVNDVEITARIGGRISRPELAFSSSPAHSQYEIFSLLVTGTISPSDAERSNLEAQAASLLAAVSSPQLQQKISQSLGIDRAKLGFGETIDQPILTVGKRVSRRVYLETHYHHNAPDDENTAEVRVQYDFARRWSLQTHFGDAAVGGVGTYWSRTLAAPEWKVSPEQRAARHERRRTTVEAEQPDEREVPSENQDEGEVAADD